MIPLSHVLCVTKCSKEHEISEIFDRQVILKNRKMKVLDLHETICLKNCMYDFTIYLDMYI